MSGINFLEAINSEKRFRVIGSERAYGWIELKNGTLRYNFNPSFKELSDYEFFNSKFETEEKTAEITENKIRKMLQMTRSDLEAELKNLFK